jgi:hypothetical protein
MIDLERGESLVECNVDVRGPRRVLELVQHDCGDVVVAFPGGDVAE